MATAAEIAAHLDLSERSVRDLKKRAILPGAGRGDMNPDACRLAYIRHLRSSAAGRGGAGPGSLEVERARLAAAQAEAVERKNAHDRGDIISRAAVDGAVTALVTITMARLERIGANVARGDHKLRVRIETAVHDAMKELSETTPEAIIAASGGSLSVEDDDEEA